MNGAALSVESPFPTPWGTRADSLSSRTAVHGGGLLSCELNWPVCLRHTFNVGPTLKCRFYVQCAFTPSSHRPPSWRKAVRSVELPSSAMFPKIVPNSGRSKCESCRATGDQPALWLSRPKKRRWYVPVGPDCLYSCSRTEAGPWDNNGRRADGPRSQPLYTTPYRAASCSRARAGLARWLGL